MQDAVSRCPHSERWSGRGAERSQSRSLGDAACRIQRLREGPAMGPFLIRAGEGARAAGGKASCTSRPRVLGGGCGCSGAGAAAAAAGPVLRRTRHAQPCQGAVTSAGGVVGGPRSFHSFPRTRRALTGPSEGVIVSPTQRLARWVRRGRLRVRSRMSQRRRPARAAALETQAHAASSRR